MANEQPTLTVVVPFYNEAATLRTSVERLLKADVPVPMEVVLVDDGSTDGAADTVSDLIEEHDVRLVRHSRNRGKGAAVRTGIEEARGDILTILDADLEYDPTDYAALLRPLLDGDAEVVYGTRSFGAHTAYSFWYVLGNKFISFWASFLFDTWLSDVETCFKLAPTSLWRDLGLTSNDFGMEAESTAKFRKRGHRIYEVPIQYKARTREEGKKLKWTDGLKAMWLLLRWRIRA